MQLAEKLDNFIGTERYYKVNLTPMLVTDGVKYFASEGEAYWAVDEICFTAMELKQPFLSVKIISDKNKAKIIFEDGDLKVLKTIKIPFTDLEKGEYEFYVIDNIVLLKTEY